MYVIGLVLPVVVLHNEVAAVDSIVVLAEALRAASPGEVEVCEALVLDLRHLVRRDVLSNGGQVLADNRHQHLLLRAVHLGARQALLLGEHRPGRVVRKDVERRFVVDYRL